MKTRIRRYLRHGMLPQMRVLEAVVRHGSFTRAGEELHMAQPTVSLHVKKLTETVGMPLLQCSGKRVQATEAGRALCAACEEIVGALTRFDDAVSGLRDVEAGTLRIVAGTAETYIVPRLLAQFLRRHPGIEASVQFVSREAVLERAGQDTDDVYLATLPPATGELVALPILSNPFMVFARPDHPLRSMASIPFSRFAQEPLLAREPGSGTRVVTDEAFSRRGLAPRFRIELGGNEAIKAAVLADLGVAILARYALGLDLDSVGLAVLDVEGFPIDFDCCLVYPAGKRLSPVAQAFASMVTAEGETLLHGEPRREPLLRALG